MMLFKVTPELVDIAFPVFFPDMAKSVFKNASVDRDKIFEMVRGYANSPTCYFRYAMEDSEMVGFFFGWTHEMWFSRDVIGEELFHYVAPSYRGRGIGREMAAGFFDWCQVQSDVKAIHYSNSFGINVEHSEKIYTDLGAVHVGGYFIKEL